MFIFAAVLISLSVRVIILIKNSSFTGNSFTLLLFSDKQYVIGVEKVNKGLSVISLEKLPKPLSHTDAVRDGIIVGIPIDGILITKNSAPIQDVKKDFFSNKNVFSLITNPFQSTAVSFNSVDLVKMYLIARAAPGSNVSFKKITNVDYDKRTEQDVFNLFKDEALVNEKTSVEIVNATTINGLGARTAKMLEHIGMHVVSIISSDKEEKHTKIIFRGRETETLKRLRGIFKVTPVYKDETYISDITVVLGKDISY